MQKLLGESLEDTYSQIVDSETYQNNKIKEKALNTIVEMILDELKIDYKDLMSHNNFINSIDPHEAEYLIPQIAVIENKNWDCYNHKGYTVTKQKAQTEIILAYHGTWDIDQSF